LARVKVTWFKRRTVTIGPVEVEALAPSGAEEVEVQAKGVDAALQVAESAMKSRKGDFAVIEAEGGETRYVIGEGIKDRTGTRLLSPTPQRLTRVGVLRLQHLSQAQQEGLERLTLNSVEWYDAPPDTYLYDGPMKAEEDVEYVLLQFEGGQLRIIRAPRLSRLLLSLRPPSEQVQEAPGGEPSEGEGSSPSE
jgi:hypothetical protein